MVADDSIETLLAQAASARGSQAAELYLTAAWRYFEGGDLAAASGTLARVRQEDVAASSLTRYQLLAAELALAAGDLDLAESYLAAIQAGSGDDARAAVRLLCQPRCRGRGGGGGTGERP